VKSAVIFDGVFEKEKGEHQLVRLLLF